MAGAIRAPARARADVELADTDAELNFADATRTTGELTTGESTTRVHNRSRPAARIPPATSTRRCPGSGPLAWVGEWATEVFWTKRKMGRRRMGMGTFWGDAGDRRARASTRRSRRRRRTNRPRATPPPAESVGRRAAADRSRRLAALAGGDAARRRPRVESRRREPPRRTAIDDGSPPDPVPVVRSPSSPAQSIGRDERRRGRRREGHVRRTRGPPQRQPGEAHRAEPADRSRAESHYDPNALPFEPLAISDMLAAPQQDLERFLTQIYRSVAHSSPINEKVNTLAYFETLCTDTAAANVLINSSLMTLFVRMLRASKAPTLRMRLSSVMGLLLRHATYMSEELASSGVVTVLTECLKDKNERVRRRAMATLGELLFYIATQQHEAGLKAPADGSGGPPARGRSRPPPWAR